MMMMMNYLSSLDFELIVDTGSEVMENDHLALRTQTSLFFDPHPNLFDRKCVLEFITLDFDDGT